MRVITDLKQMIVNAQKNDVKIQDKSDAIYENGSFGTGAWYPHLFSS